MKFLTIRNYKKIKKYILNEKIYLILKYITYNKKLPLKTRFKASLLLSKYKIFLSSTRRRCKLTGRGRGFFRFFGTSRLISRERARFNQLPFIQKYSW